MNLLFFKKTCNFSTCETEDDCGIALLKIVLNNFDNFYQVLKMKLLLTHVIKVNFSN